MLFSPQEATREAVGQAGCAHLFGSEFDVVGHAHVLVGEGIGVEEAEARARVFVARLADSLGVLSVRSGNRYLINPGSVGQPRDGTPRPSFGLFDTETFGYENVRVPYNADRAAEKIRAAGLPERLAERLLRGK